MKRGLYTKQLTPKEQDELNNLLIDFVFPNDLDKIVPEEKKYWVAQMKDGELDFYQQAEPVSATVAINLKK